MPDRVLLIRHGQTEWSRDGRHTGRTDIPLTPEGEVQARALRPRLAGESIARVLCSPLERARQTAALAGIGEDAQVVDDLAEWDYGQLEGRTSRQMQEAQPGWELWADGAPGGEPIEVVAARVDRVIAQVLAPAVPDPEGSVVALVAHGHVLRVLAARWLEQEPGFAARLRLGTASLCELGFQRGRRTVERWNDVAHLPAA